MTIFGEPMTVDAVINQTPFSLLRPRLADACSTGIQTSCVRMKFQIRDQVIYGAVYWCMGVPCAGRGPRLQLH